MGYAGGTQPNPTYRALGDHTETLQVDFDPGRVSYEQLLAVFWRSHDPFAPAHSRQYRAAVFTHDEEQARLAAAARNRVAAQGGGGVVRTEIIPFVGFTRAEDYHQKYYLSHFRDLEGELRGVYPDPKDYVDSTAAARLNGYAGGNGSKEQLRAEIDSLGLSARGKDRLWTIAGDRN